MVRRAAIILAGGRGARFQNEKEWQDKALAPLFGKPLLVHVVENVRKLVDEIVVCVNDEERKARYAKILTHHKFSEANLVVDEKIDHLGGPLVAIFSGLKFSSADYCITLPGDMPLVQSKVVEYMFEKAKEARVVVPMWPNGRLETLMMTLEKPCALEIADTLCQLGRPRSDDLIRGALNVIFLSIIGDLATLDPEFKSFVNINFPEDLAQLQPRRGEGPLSTSLHLIRGTLPVDALNDMREAVTSCRETNFLNAAMIFSSCADFLEKQNSYFWAAVARENEGKSYRSLSKSQTEPSLAKSFLANGRNAFHKAAETYGFEAKMHEESSCFFLANRAINDKMWCEARASELRSSA